MATTSVYEKKWKKKKKMKEEKKWGGGGGGGEFTNRAVCSDSLLIFSVNDVYDELST